MFTGLVETVGEIVSVAQADAAAPRRLTVRSALPGAEIELGASIAIDGCCLTVVANDASGLAFEAAQETLQVTTLGQLERGARVHLERALRLGDRLGGHVVAGHVDGMGTVQATEQRGSGYYIRIQAPAPVSRLVAARGSITVAGVSLTVTWVEKHSFEVCLIPHTLEVTELGRLKVGQRVNLEADLMARYVERLMQATQEDS